MSGVVTISITRKALYERVWAESVIHVAPELGVWPTRLSKLCAKNRIPVPGRGYWYHSTSDRKTMRDPLPDADQDWEISFAPSQPGPPRPGPEEQTAPKIVVPDRLPSRPHRLVLEARAAINASRSLEHGRCLMPERSLGILVSPDSAKRALRIMDTLLKVCKARRWSVSATPHFRSRTVVQVQDCEVHLYLQEGLRQAPRELRDWEKGLAIESGRKRGPYELVPQGRLTLSAECVGVWYGAQWRDGKRRRLEDMLDAVVAHLEGAPEAKSQADKERAAAAERRRVEEQLRREEEERQRERQRVRLAEQARVNALVADAEAWDQCQKVRAYIDAQVAKVQTAAQPTDAAVGPDSDFGRWVSWARAQADRMDPLMKTPASAATDQENDETGEDEADDGLF